MSRQLLRLLISAATLGGVALFGTGLLAEPVSDKYDGRYAGEIEVIWPLSTGACEDGTDYDVEIRNGSIHGEALTSGAKIQGIVTSDGFCPAATNSPTAARTISKA